MTNPRFSTVHLTPQNEPALVAGRQKIGALVVSDDRTDQQLRDAGLLFARVVHCAPNTADRWEWITLPQFAADCATLARRLPWPIAGAVGVPRSGTIVAGIVATTLNVPLYGLTQHGLELLPGQSRRLDEHAVHRGPIVLCDDDCFSGLTLRRTRQRISGIETITFAPYLWKKSPDPPQFWLREFPCTWICEWRFFSSFFVFKTGYDFDGLICRDCRPDEDDDGPKYLNFIRTAAPPHR